MKYNNLEITLTNEMQLQLQLSSPIEEEIFGEILEYTGPWFKIQTTIGAFAIKTDEIQMFRLNNDWKEPK